MDEVEIRAKLFVKDDLRTYIALTSFFLLGVVIAIWLIFKLYKGSTQNIYFLLALGVISWIFIILVCLSYRMNNIIISNKYIKLPKTLQKHQILDYDEIKEIRYDLFKKTGNVGKLEIIDVNGKKHRISSFADKTKMLREIKKRMSKEHWKRKTVKEGYR